MIKNLEANNNLNKKKQISIFGLGYVGFPTANLIASKGYKVIGVDINEKLVNSINSGDYVFEEEEINNLFKENLKKKNFFAQLAATFSDIFFICVPTPVTANNEPDLIAVNSVIKKIIPFLKPYNLVIVESTIPVGTTDEIKKLILNSRKDLKEEEVLVAHCPERVLPGNTINELIENDRVIGGVNKKSSLEAEIFYKSFCTGSISLTTSKTAELAKLAENTYRDVNIAFANQLSTIALKEKINIQELIEIANKHPRVSIHKPGIGVGGHCIPVDPWFLIKRYEDINLIKTARLINLNKENIVVEKIINFLNLRKDVEKIYLFGLSYKPDVGDFRESPAIRIFNKLASKVKKEVIGMDPNIFKININLKINQQLIDKIPEINEKN